jgi:hypothetical protein
VNLGIAAGTEPWTTLCSVHAMMLARAISDERLSCEILKALAQHLKERFVKALPRGQGATRLHDNTSASLEDRLLASFVLYRITAASSKFSRGLRGWSLFGSP